MLPDIPAGWQAVFGTFFTALAGGVVWLFKSRRDERLADSARKDALIASLQDKVDKAQEDKFNLLKEQLTEAAKRRETDERVGRSIEELSNLMRTKLEGTKS